MNLLSCLFIFSLTEKNKKFTSVFTRNISELAALKLQTLRGKQKYQITNVGVQKIKLSRLLVQRINELKMNEIQCKSPQ